jgi:hypothetical protein
MNSGRDRKVLKYTSFEHSELSLSTDFVYCRYIGLSVITHLAEILNQTAHVYSYNNISFRVIKFLPPPKYYRF